MASIDGMDSMSAGDAAGGPDASGAATDAVGAAASGKKRARGKLSLRRVQRKQQRAQREQQRAQREQQQAVAALQNAGESPGLGALNRQLTLLLQQLGAAHRLLGRVAAERDALRQQLADLQGIPVEEIVVPSATAAEGLETEAHRVG